MILCKENILPRSVFVKVCLSSFFLLFFLQKVQSQTIGLIENSSLAMPGYILFAPLHSRTTYLIDRCGRSVHSWKSKYKPGQSAYLLPNGNLLRTANDSNMAFINAGGVIEKLDWNGNVLWNYSLSTPTMCLHHDICLLPNGNILALLWERKTRQEAIAAGRKPELTGKSVLTERIVELKPKGRNDAIIVWEWKVWNHLVQDIDSGLPHYGSVAKNAQLININYRATTDEDWLHFNSLVYNPDLDQILVGNRNFSEFFIIDHNTTKAQAASHTGGRYEKGGDILFRWGNASAYNCGTAATRNLYMQHNPHWIEKGLEDEGRIMIFNNGMERVNPFSRVDIIEPPLTPQGTYSYSPGEPFKPEKPYWSYGDSITSMFYSHNVSNAQRLPNGNTLICEGANGKFFEIDKNQNVVWKYINPVTLKGAETQGTTILENQVFRCYFYSTTFRGFKGRKLIPGKPIELNPLLRDCNSGIK